MKNIYIGKEKPWNMNEVPSYVVNCAERFTIKLALELSHVGVYWGNEYKNKSGQWGEYLMDYNGLFINFKNFDFGQSHMYYDGPHCMISFGFLHYSWSPINCDKCLSEDPEVDYSTTWFKKLFQKKDRFKNFR